jgi:proteasome lid subunit RPN8/RPN11
VYGFFSFTSSVLKGNFMNCFNWPRLSANPCVAVLPDWRNGTRFSRGVSVCEKSETKSIAVATDRPSDDENTEDSAIESDTPPLLRITRSACNDAVQELGDRTPEYAGILLGPKDSDIVTHFVADEQGAATRSSFTLNVDWLNKVIRRFVRCGIDVKGVVHSHPPGVPSPSQGDLAYVRDVFATPKNDDADELFLPIFCDGRLHPFVIGRDIPLRIRAAELVLI